MKNGKLSSRSRMIGLSPAERRCRHLWETLILVTDAGHPIDTYLTAAEEGSVAAQFVLGLAHLEGYCAEKNALSAYYWPRLAEASSRELGRRSRALVVQLGSTGKKHEIEDVEHRVSSR